MLGQGGWWLHGLDDVEHSTLLPAAHGGWVGPAGCHPESLAAIAPAAATSALSNLLLGQCHRMELTIEGRLSPPASLLTQGGRSKAAKQATFTPGPTACTTASNQSAGTGNQLQGHAGARHVRVACPKAVSATHARMHLKCLVSSSGDAATCARGAQTCASESLVGRFCAARLHCSRALSGWQQTQHCRRAELCQQYQSKFGARKSHLLAALAAAAPGRSCSGACCESRERAGAGSGWPHPVHGSKAFLSIGKKAASLGATVGLRIGSLGLDRARQRYQAWRGLCCVCRAPPGLLGRLEGGCTCRSGGSAQAQGQQAPDRHASQLQRLMVFGHACVPVLVACNCACWRWCLRISGLAAAGMPKGTAIRTLQGQDGHSPANMTDTLAQAPAVPAPSTAISCSRLTSSSGGPPAACPLPAGLWMPECPGSAGPLVSEPMLGTLDGSPALTASG